MRYLLTLLCLLTCYIAGCRTQRLLGEPPDTRPQAQLPVDSLNKRPAWLSPYRPDNYPGYTPSTYPPRRKI